MTVLAFDEVTCERGGRLLFERTSFELRPGDALSVTGANGVGKSSLLRVAAGLLAPTAGAVRSEGRIALADEHHALDTAQTLARALAFWAAGDGGDAGAAIEAVGLGHLRDVPVRMLSTGQRRRATLARTLAARADIWLLDEPTNGLDAGGVAMLERLVADHRERGGIAVVATHLPIAVPGSASLVL